MSVLRVENLSIEFGGLKAVDTVSFSVNAGEIVSVIGPNGAGKTTLFNMISSLYTPTSGSVFLNGENVTHVQPHILAQRGLSRTFQNLQIFPDMTVLENVIAGCHLQERGSIWSDLFSLPGMRKKCQAAKDKAYRLLERIDMHRAAEREASSLSYGSLKKLEIARALAVEPKILLLDETAAGCNAVESEAIATLIKEVAASGISILLVEHDMKMVMNISNHLVVLDHGEKIAEGTPAEVSQNEDVIAAYLGTQAVEGEG